MKLLKAVIFDVDGTLAETERDGHRVAFNRAFEMMGLDWHWNEQLYGELLSVTGGKERIYFYLKQFNPGMLDQPDIEDFVTTLHAEKTNQYLALLASRAITFRPGIVRLLTEIHQAGIRLAVATTTTPQNVEALLVNQLGADMLNWFDCIAAGDVVAHKKPAGDIYEFCLQQLGLDADDCLAIEDSQHGLHAALAVGLKTIVTCNNYTRNENFTGAAALFEHLGEAEQPCKQFAGLPIKGDYVTLNDLKMLHAYDFQ